MRGRLGDFLEVVYGTPEPFITVRASLRQWCDRRLADEARGGNRTVIGRRSVKPGGAPQTEEATLSAWIAPPERTRVEKEAGTGGQAESSLTVVNGDRWWERDHEGHVEMPGPGRQSPPGLGDVRQHFGRARLRECLGALALEHVGGARTAGQECVRVRAVPRPGALLWSHWLPSGADEYEFHAHPERGVLLSITARAEGRVFEVSEVTAV